MPTSENAAAFPPVSYAAWRAGVEAELGADGVSRRLRAMTEDGIAIEPLYAPGGPGDGEARNLAGRVLGLLREGAGGLRIRQRFPVGTSSEILRSALLGGVRSLEFEGDGHGQQYERILRALHELRDLSPSDKRVNPSSDTHLELSFHDITADEEGINVAFPFNPVSWGSDPIGRWLRLGGSVNQVVLEVAGYTAVPHLGSDDNRPYRAAGECFYDAGATSGMTLGATLAVALTYLRAMERGGHALIRSMKDHLASYPFSAKQAAALTATVARGVDMEWAASRIEVRLPCGPRFFESAAMLRAARLVWARILDASGIAPTPLRLVAITGRRTLTRHDPWNNALRNTSVAFAAAIGGADVLQLLPHDIRNAESSAATLRLARTTGLILQEEAHLGRVLDPAEGSWFLESLTSQLAEEAWAELRRLEAAGGIVAAIESGDLSRRIAEAAAARHERVKARRHPIIGVTEHPVEGEVVVPSAAEIAEVAVSSPFPFRPDAQPFEGSPR